MHYIYFLRDIKTVYFQIIQNQLFIIYFFTEQNFRVRANAHDICINVRK